MKRAKKTEFDITDQAVSALLVMPFTVELRINWELWREQKRLLLLACEQYGHPLDGLLNLCDHIQDVAEAAGEPVLPLTEETADA